jgi:hypothetical protein
LRLSCNEAKWQEQIAKLLQSGPSCAVIAYRLNVSQAGKSIVRKLLIVAGMLGSSAAHAQMTTIVTPGQNPTYVYPTPNGGGRIITPGQSPTYIYRNGSNNYTVVTPGQMPTYIYTNPGPRVNSLDDDDDDDD